MKQTALLQHRHDEVDKVVQAFGCHRARQIEAVDTTIHDPCRCRRSATCSGEPTIGFMRLPSTIWSMIWRGVTGFTSLACDVPASAD